MPAQRVAQWKCKLGWACSFYCNTIFFFLVFLTWVNAVCELHSLGYKYTVLKKSWAQLALSCVNILLGTDGAIPFSWAHGSWVSPRTMSVLVPPCQLESSGLGMRICPATASGELYHAVRLTWPTIYCGRFGAPSFSLLKELCENFCNMM